MVKIKDLGSPPVLRLIKNCLLGKKDMHEKNGVCENFIDCDKWDECPYGD